MSTTSLSINLPPFLRTSYYAECRDNVLVFDTAAERPPNPVNTSASTQEHYAQSVEAAKAICDACPISPECLAYALGNKYEVGVWAGTTEDERKELRG